MNILRVFFLLLIMFGLSPLTYAVEEKKNDSTIDIDVKQCSRIDEFLGEKGDVCIAIDIVNKKDRSLCIPVNFLPLYDLQSVVQSPIEIKIKDTNIYAERSGLVVHVDNKINWNRSALVHYIFADSKFDYYYNLSEHYEFDKDEKYDVSIDISAYECDSFNKETERIRLKKTVSFKN